MVAEFLACSLLSAIIALPPGFVRQEVAVGLDRPADLAFLPDGRMLVLSVDGEMVILDPHATPPVLPESYLSVPVCTAMPGASVSLVVDPGFSANHSIYLYYCNPDADGFRLSRFLHLAGTAQPDTESVVWESELAQNGPGHYGGGLDFGPDGNIYLATGDQLNGDWAQDLSNTDGSILRIAPDGSVPAGNPFADGPGNNNDYIWAFGLRNPFRASWDLPTGRFFVGEVGDGPTSWEDIHLGGMGLNYGWPFCHGGCDSPEYPECSCEDHDDPLFTYPHDGLNACVIGGVVYRGGHFPEDPYAGAYFYGDHSQRWIRYLRFDESGLLVTGDFEFDDDAGAVVAIAVGPDGALYWADYFGRIRRVIYDDGNPAPVITSADAKGGPGTAPLSVTFSGSATDDEPELEYRWSFGDGAEAVGAVVDHVYDSNGVYAARLAVSDATHTSYSPAIIVQVGAFPTVTIDTPADGSSFTGGETIAFSATAEDGDERLGDANFSWTVHYLHGGILEPVLGPVGGADGSFIVPTSGLPVDGDSGYRISLTVTDSDGFSASASVFVEPSLVELTVDTIPAGLEVGLDAAPVTAPETRTVLVGSEMLVEAPTQCTPGGPFTFASWSDGGASSHVITVPDADSTLTATFEQGAPLDGDANNDGVVDVDDLLAVILVWGACGAPGECDGDLDCDGDVDVDDLIAVLLTYGT
ncbi:MAG: PQQ-dependent sugar dehydrogenase [Planctomycetota bacterium]|jgi:glucose/arabinose dehydrogenase